jgi:enoyl-CoA hydratase/carnithine racemase
VLEVVEDRNVVYLRVAEPVRLGADSNRLAWQLVDACQRIHEADDRPVAVALVGLGRAFCTLPPSSAADCDAVADAWREATAAIAALAPPTLGILGGDAIGPALELALACDLRIAAAEARLGTPEVHLGRIPSAGGTQRLARALGRGVALRMLLLGEELTAAEAMNLRLVQRLAPAQKLEACAEEALDSLRAAAPIALAYAKEAIRGGAELPMASGLTLEADLAALLQSTEDRAEGIQAFKEQRAPLFEGR